MQILLGYDQKSPSTQRPVLSRCAISLGLLRAAHYDMSACAIIGRAPMRPQAMAGVTSSRCGCRCSPLKAFTTRNKLTSSRLSQRQQRSRQVRASRHSICKPAMTLSSSRQKMTVHHVCNCPSCLQVVTMGIFGLGGPELAVIAGVAVLIFGQCLLCFQRYCCALVLLSYDWSAMLLHMMLCRA